jgi:hypothetical protein
MFSRFLSFGTKNNTTFRSGTRLFSMSSNGQNEQNMKFYSGQEKYFMNQARFNDDEENYNG